jgi:predicted amino acid-binding ACT domain protein
VDQPMGRVFVSCLPAQEDTLRKMAFQSCVRSGLDPYSFDWEVGASPEGYLQRRMEDCHLFIGIYEKEYGQRIVGSQDSEERISAIDFELQAALRVLGSRNVLLFARKGDHRDADLNRILARTKLDVTLFDRDLDFNLLIDEEVKKWRSWHAYRVSQATPRTVSVKLECRDRSGILAAVYKTIYVHGGNVVRSRQTTHLGTANATIIAQWQEGAEYPREEAVRESLQHELHALLGETTGALEVVRLSTQDGEIKAKGNFSVLFFDGPGIAERIFAVFARSSTSILESYLTQVSVTPPMARFVMDVNATNITHEKVNHLAQELRAQAGIVAVEAHMEIGSWWY